LDADGEVAAVQNKLDGLILFGGEFFGRVVLAIAAETLVTAQVFVYQSDHVAFGFKAGGCGIFGTGSKQVAGGFHDFEGRFEFVQVHRAASMLQGGFKKFVFASNRNAFKDMFNGVVELYAPE
jgi:hypothetical protein